MLLSMFVIVGSCLNASVGVCSCRFVFECSVDVCYCRFVFECSVGVCSCRLVFECFCWCLFL